MLIIIVSACSEDSNVVDPPNNGTPYNGNRVVIFYTNDEHGWMKPTDTHGGAAGMMGLWKDVEGYTENGEYLILSGGDMWTGPSISTWFEGESMVEVMNAMNYSAAAFGNHEVDFGLDGLDANASASNFPYLSANVKIAGSNQSPDYLQPYLIEEVNGVKVGIIGLTTNSMPGMVFPQYVANLEFQSYATALNDVVPELSDAGAELLIVIGHLTVSEVESIAGLCGSLGISLIGGGHDHQTNNVEISGVTCIESGANMENYAKVEIMFDTLSNSVISISSDIVPNTGGTPDAQITNIVSGWQTQLDAALSEVIGYTETGINRYSDGMYNMIADSWLVMFPSAEIAFSNTGGVRQSIPAGNITLATMVGLLPFDNEILQLELTGNQLINSIGYFFVGGMTTIDGYKLTDGTPIDESATYNVLTIDYLYYLDEYLQSYDPTPYETSVNYRQPVIDWIKSLNTTSSDPLENYLDNTPRR